jgi:sulfur carrier protein ThiS
MDLIPLSSLTGPQGPIGLTGQDGKDGDEVLLQLTDTHLQWKYVGAAEWTNLLTLSSLIGETGKSAYEAYVEAYPGYTADEATWLFELANNELRVVLTVVYSNGYVDLVNYVKGQPIGASTYDVPWFLDAAYTQAADSHYMSADTTVYINKVHPVVPVEVAGVHKILTIDQVGTTLNPIYRLVMTDGTVLELGEFFNLYAADGQFIATTPKAILEIAGNTTAPKLKAGDIVTDVVQELGKVTSLRFASKNVEIATKSSSVLTVSGNKITVAYGTTVAQVLENIKPLASVDSRVQTYAVRKDSDGSIVASGNIATSQYLEVISEDGSSKTYDFAIGKNPDTTLKLAKNPAWQMVAIDNVLKEVHVRPGTLASDIATSLTDSNTDFHPSFFYVNSEGIVDPAASKVGALVNGDKLVVMDSNYDTEIYYIKVVESASTDLKLVTGFGPELVSVNNDTGIITVSWNTLTTVLEDALINDVTTVNGAPLASKEFKFNGKTLAVATDEPDLVRDQTTNKFFELTVKSQDESLVKTYKFAIEASKSTKIEVKDASAHLAEVVGKEVAVRADLSVAELLAALQSDDTSVQTYAVKNSEGVAKVGTAKLFLGDKLVVTSAFGGTPVEYLITVNDKLQTSDIRVKASPVVVISTDGGQIIVKPQFGNYPIYSNTTLIRVLADLDFAYNAQTYKLYRYDTETSAYVEITTQGALALEDVFIKVIPQNGIEPAQPTHKIVVDAKLGDPSLTYVDEPAVLDGQGGLVVDQQTLSSTNAYVTTTFAMILADLNFSAKLQTYSIIRNVDGEWKVVSSATGIPLDELGIRVFAQSHTTEAPVYNDYGITVNSSNVVNITLVDKPAVITSHTETYDGIDVVGAMYNVLVNPQYVLKGAYVNTALNNILADIDLTNDFQKSKTAMMANDTNDGFIPFTGTDLSKLYIRITAQDGSIGYFKVVIDDLKDVVTYTLDGDNKGLITPDDENSLILNVPFGTTVADLLAELDLVANFQKAAVYQNDGTTAKIGTAALADYNLLRISAQDSTTLDPNYQDYIIMVKAAPVVGSAALKSTEAKYVVDNVNMTITIKTTLEKINGGVPVKDLTDKLSTIDGLTDIDESMVVASDRAEKQFGLFNDDLLVFTPLNSVEEVVYTIIVIEG